MENEFCRAEELLTRIQLTVRFERCIFKKSGMAVSRVDKALECKKQLVVHTSMVFQKRKLLWLMKLNVVVTLTLTMG